MRLRIIPRKFHVRDTAEVSIGHGVSLFPEIEPCTGRQAGISIRVGVGSVSCPVTFGGDIVAEGAALLRARAARRARRAAGARTAAGRAASILRRSCTPSSSRCALVGGRAPVISGTAPKPGSHGKRRQYSPKRILQYEELHPPKDGGERPPRQAKRLPRTRGFQPRARWPSWRRQDRAECFPLAPSRLRPR
jgi:hypothetical protein